jgi:hypothetical protein
MEKDLETLRGWSDWVLNTQAGRTLALGALCFYVLVWWRILARAGFPGALALLMLVPPLALGLWSFLAFAPWPARRELSALRKVQRVVHQAERRRLIA